LVVSEDGSDEPDCNLASRDSDAPGTFSEEVSHLSIGMNMQTFDGICLTFFSLHSMEQVVATRSNWKLLPQVAIGEVTEAPSGGNGEDQRMLVQLVSSSRGTPQVLSSNSHESEFQAEGKKIPSLAPGQSIG
jgi:hypothetical protein